MWRGGCIIRSKFLSKIKLAYDKNPKLSNLLVDPFFIGEIVRCIPAWRQVVAQGALQGVPLPCFSTALLFLRQLPQRSPPGQPAPGPARLFWRPHLRADRQTARPVLPHQLDRHRRQHQLQHLQCLKVKLFFGCIELFGLCAIAIRFIGMILLHQLPVRCSAIGFGSVFIYA